MDKCLIRLTRMRWYAYGRPEVALGILKQIANDIRNLLHNRMVRNWGILTKKQGLRRSQSLPNLYMSDPNHDREPPPAFGRHVPFDARVAHDGRL